MTTLELEQIVAQLESLPKLPDTTMRLIHVINDPASSIEQIVDTIRFDQSVTTQLLRLCNSAFFGLSRPINSIEDAACYVGTTKLMQLVMAAHTQALLGPEQSGYGLVPGALWKHSVAVALGSQMLADQLDRSRRGLLFTAGLLHDIGKIVLNEYVATEFAAILQTVQDERISFCDAEQRVVGISHSEIGARAAAHWKLPDTIQQCIQYHHEPSALETPDTMVDIVHLADAACLLIGIGGGDDGQLYRADEGALERTGLRIADIERTGAAVIAELKAVQTIFGIK